MTFVATACPLDLVILVDSSGYWTGEFARLKNGINAFISQLNYTAENTHVACVEYSTTAQLVFNLVQYKTANDLTNGINNQLIEDSAVSDTNTNLVNQMFSLSL